jgi:hypothetical protein
MIVGASATGLLASALLFLRLGRRWGRASFSYVSTDA